MIQGKDFTTHTVREVRDFVKTLCREGHDDFHVTTVASQTRWAKHLEEVCHWLSKRGLRWRERGGRKPLDGSQVRQVRNYGKIGAG